MAGCLCCDGTERRLSVSHTPAVEARGDAEKVNRISRTDWYVGNSPLQSAAGERSVWFHILGVCMLLC